MERSASFHGSKQLIASVEGSEFRRRNQLIRSAKRSKCLLPVKEATASFHGRKQLLPSAEGRNCFDPQKEAIASFRRRKQFLPPMEGSNCLLPHKETIPSSPALGRQLDFSASTIEIFEIFRRVKFHFLMLFQFYV